MRIITCNVNGLRSAHAKGFTTWLARQKPDVACFQETTTTHCEGVSCFV